MTPEQIILAIKQHADRHGIDLQLPAVLSVFDLQDVVETFGMYGHAETGEELANRYVHAELVAA